MDIPAYLKNPWQIKKTSLPYDNPWIQVKHHDVIHPSGNDGIYGVVHFKNLAIGILPIDKDGYTYLVGQYRFPINQYSWEIPEGGSTFGEEPLETAKRELEEECGLLASSWEQLMELHLSNSATDEKAIVFLAKELSIGNLNPEESEQLEIKKVHFNELYQMVIDGKITDAITVAAVLKYNAIKPKI
jgi:8-oxo-dGTP pyrophosphatase MutT (NUDIX family)